jgi:hypothetical protein
VQILGRIVVSISCHARPQFSLPLPACGLASELACALVGGGNL